MTTKDQAIARFVEAVKLDRHDWEDWPTDSREAFIALQQPAPDCRTCKWKDHCKDGIDMRCTNGNQYVEAPAVVLWSTK
jgi:hypothetical protein